MKINPQDKLSAVSIRSVSIVEKNAEMEIVELGKIVLCPLWRFQEIEHLRSKKILMATSRCHDNKQFITILCL